MGEALEIAVRFFDAPLSWFDELLRMSGMWGFYFSILAMFVAFRFLVAPILGVYGDALSDTARKSARKTLKNGNMGKQSKKGG